MPGHRRAKATPSFGRLCPGMTTWTRTSRQQPLPRHMIELEPDAVGVLEQNRVVAGRPLILARGADDFGPHRIQEAIQLIDVGAFAGAEAEMMQPDALLLERRAGVLGRRRADPNRRASA